MTEQIENYAVILVANSKGGVTKTTTAVNVGHGLAQLGKKVLLLDLDAQGHIAFQLGIKRDSNMHDFIKTGQATIIDSGRKNLSLIPGGEPTAIAVSELPQRPWSHLILKNAIKPLLSHFHFVLIDTPPGISPVTVSAIVASTHVLVPVTCDDMAIDGLYEYTESLATAQNNGVQCVLAWVVPARYDKVTTVSGRSLGQIADEFSRVVTDPIPNRTAMEKAVAAKQTIWEYEPRGDVARAYARLVKRILDDLGVSYGNGGSR
jgi:chromosome partitioning protein